MSLILPIMIMAVVVGLFAKRLTPPVYFGMAVWIVIVSVHYLLKN